MDYNNNDTYQPQQQQQQQQQQHIFNNTQRQHQSSIISSSGATAPADNFYSQKSSMVPPPSGVPTAPVGYMLPSGQQQVQNYYCPAEQLDELNQQHPLGQQQQQQQQIPTFLDLHQQSAEDENQSNGSFTTAAGSSSSSVASSPANSSSRRTHDPYNLQHRVEESTSLAQQQQDSFVMGPTLQQSQLHRAQHHPQNQQQYGSSTAAPTDFPAFNPVQQIGSGSSYYEDSLNSGSAGSVGYTGGYYTSGQYQQQQYEASSSYNHQQQQRQQQQQQQQQQEFESSWVPTVWARHRHHGTVERMMVTTSPIPPIGRTASDFEIRSATNSVRSAASIPLTSPHPEELVHLNMPPPPSVTTTTTIGGVFAPAGNAAVVTSPRTPSLLRIPVHQQQQEEQQIEARSTGDVPSFISEQQCSPHDDDGTESIQSQSFRSSAPSTTDTTTTTTTVNTTTQRKPPKRQVTLASIQKKAGKYLGFAKSAAGSSILQAGLYQHPEVADLIAAELLPHMKKLVLDRNAAYVARELLARLPPTQIGSTLEELITDSSLMCLMATRDLHSRRMFQFLLNLAVNGSDAGVPSNSQSQRFTSALEAFAMEWGLHLASSENGCIAIQRLLDVLPGRSREQFFSLVVRSNFQSLSLNPFGHYVVLYMLNHRHHHQEDDDEALAESSRIANSEAFANAFSGALRDFIQRRPACTVIEQAMGNLSAPLERQIIVELFSFTTESQRETLYDATAYNVLVAAANYCSKNESYEGLMLCELALASVRDARKQLPYSAQLENLETCLVEGRAK